MCERESARSWLVVETSCEGLRSRSCDLFYESSSTTHKESSSSSSRKKGKSTSLFPYSLDKGWVFFKRIMLTMLHHFVSCKQVHAHYTASGKKRLLVQFPFANGAIMMRNSFACVDEQQ